MNPIRRLLCVFVILNAVSITAQKQGNTWLFGNSIYLDNSQAINFGLDFNYFPTKRFSIQSTYKSSGNYTAISDLQGGLLYFGCGSWLKNKQLQILDNGDSLLNGLSQPGLLLPRPRSNDLILLQYLIPNHSGINLYRGFYSSINPSMNNGIGRMTLRSKPVDDSLTSFDATYSHGNDSIWIAWVKWGGNRINLYTLSQIGIELVHSISIQHENDSAKGIGYMRFSPNGKKIAILLIEKSILCLFDFDNISGTISNPKFFQVDHPNSISIFEFSPNSRFLYLPFGVSNNKTLLQLDLEKNFDTINNLSTVANSMIPGSWNNSSLNLKLAPDGSILWFRTNLSNAFPVDRIRFPDLPYPQCQLEPYISIDSGQFYANPPLIFTGLFNHPKAMATTNCLGDSTLFRVAFVDSDSLFFDFGDGNTALSTHSEYRYLYSDTGTFSASVRYKNTFGNWENLDVSVCIGAPPGTLVNKSLLACAQDTLLLQLPYSPNSQYLWSTGDTTAHLAYSGNGILNYTIDNQLCSVSDSLIIYRVDCEVNLPILCEEDSFSINLNQSTFDSAMLVIPGNTPTPLYFPNAIASQNIDSLGIVFFKANHSILIWYPTHFREKPPIELPPFSLGCIGESIILNPVHPDVYNYLWPDGTQYSDYMDSFSGNHILIYGDHDCEWTDSFSFVFFPCNFELGKLCQNIPVFFQLDEITPDAVFWKFGDGDSTIELGNTVTHTYTKEGNYTLQCSIILNNVIKSFSQNITIHPGPMGFGMDTIPLCFNDTLFVQDDTAELDFLWFNQQTTPYFVPQESGEVSVRLDINGCEKNDTTLVVLHECNCLDFIPNAFSPTKDQLNEYFSLTGNCIFSEFSIRLYSRWGELVFESKDPHFQFDGTFKGIPLPQEAYVYVITAKQLLSGETIHKKGILHLLK